MLSSFFFIVGDHRVPNYIGRLIAGLNHGIIHLVVIVHASDNTSKRARGAVMRSISYIMTFSLLIAIILCTPFQTYEMRIRGMGVYSIGYGIFAAILTIIATNESIPYLIMKNDLTSALHKYVKLRSERIPTPQTKKGFDIIHDTTLEDLELSNNIFVKENSHPLLLITGARLLSLFLTNIPLLIYLSNNVASRNNKDLTSPSQPSSFQITTLIIYIQIGRIIFGFVPMFFATPSFRSRLIYILCFISGITLLPILIANIFDLIPLILSFCSAVTIICYLFTSLGADAIQYVQAAEAFPLTKKQFSFAFIAIVEHLYHITIFILYNYSTPAFLLFCSVPLILFSGYLYKVMPTSSALTIRDARLKYRAT